MRLVDLHRPGAGSSVVGPRRMHVDHNYLRADTIKIAIALLIDAQSDLLLAQLRGSGFVAALDGMRFVVPVPSLVARQ